MMKKRDHRSGGPLLFRDTMPQASERHKRQGGTACRGGDGGHGDQDRPGGEGLRLYGACLLAPAGCTQGADRDHGPGRPHGGRDHGHAMSSGHRPPAPRTITPPGRGCGRAAQGRSAGMARNFLEEDTRRDSRTGGPLAEDGMQERRTVSLLRMKGWTRPPPPTAALTLPPTRKKRRRNFFRPSIYDTQPSDRTLRRFSLTSL